MEIRLNRKYYPTENWEKMSPEEKRQFRLNRVPNTEGISFVSQEAEENYKIRAKRLVDVYNVEEPDQVPYNLPFGDLPLTMHECNTHTAMYEPEKAARACEQFNEKYSNDLGAYAGSMAMPGPILDILDYKLYAYPGKGLSKDASGIQFIEGEYMMADEYDELILDPTDFFIRKYFPRIFGIMESFSTLQPVTHMTEIIFVFQQLMPLANLQVINSLQKIIEAGRALQKINTVSGTPFQGAPAQGYPSLMMGGMTKAPFDTLADTLRGTKGAIKDMYRQPDKLLEALDKIADLTISNVLNSPMAGMGVIVAYPLHKGADGWMSQKQFETFYWPSLKKVMNAFIKEGLIQHLFAEGNFNTRLESVNEFPRGAVSWLFEGSDIFRAKEILGRNCCISGNIPASLIIAGSQSEVKEVCRKLIKGCGKGGGYILACGSSPENPRLENLYAMVEAVREYGNYRYQ